ncbi:Ubiquitin domaincontaining protein UBFD1like [Caligus rogercresseyi]|uniref:Ubiquitin domaincontaining protein UBFD1like n=1 Tax=Caligus rogercresseyi TaxID=217165 RepID=A0A7T8GP11_CALRO|nr:Ubiquitin domaincontaining protein UBFD1like [Caligus rogercresseyi]
MDSSSKSREEILKETLSKASSTSSVISGDPLDFKVIYNKKKHDIRFGSDNTVGELKAHLQSIIQIPPAMMKLMIKGLAKDEMSLKSLGLSKGSKVMVIGSSLDDVMAVSGQRAAAAAREKLSKAKIHSKILDKGPLPSVPLSGMLNKYGGKVRLTFKTELDQLWIGTKERTEKLPMMTIRNVISEAISGHEEYHILALQLGATEASRYWIYWVPAQYVDAIKDYILGKWQLY